MEICVETRRAFAHAIGSDRIAHQWTFALRQHAEAVILRENHRKENGRDIAAWVAKQTRRDLPQIRKSSAVDRDIAADMANTILFNLITEGRA